MKIPECVALIDDNEADNYLHTIVINENAGDVVQFEDPVVALEQLQAGQLQPNIIFLDINMPTMNGWEFLEKFQALPEHQRKAAVILMLTTSLNEDDQKRAEAVPAISGFLPKPLTAEAYARCIEKYGTQ